MERINFDGIKIESPAEMFPIAQAAVVGTVRGSPEVVAIEVPIDAPARVHRSEVLVVEYDVEAVVRGDLSPLQADRVRISMPYLESEAPCGSLRPKDGDRELFIVRTASMLPGTDFAPVLARVGLSDGIVNAWPPMAWAVYQPLETFDGVKAEELLELLSSTAHQDVQSGGL